MIYQRSSLVASLICVIAFPFNTQAQRRASIAPNDAPPPSRWIYFETAQDGMEIFLERKIQVLSNGNKKRWVRFLRKDESYRLHFIEFDCKQNRSRFLQTTSYNAKGEPEGTSSVVTEWLNATPDSISEALIQGTCPSWKISPAEFMARKKKLAAKKKQ